MMEQGASAAGRLLRVTLGLARAETRATKRKSGAAVERSGRNDWSHAAAADMKTKHQRCEFGSGITLWQQRVQAVSKLQSRWHVSKRGDEQRQRTDQPRRLIESSGSASRPPTRLVDRATIAVCASADSVLEYA